MYSGTGDNTDDSESAISRLVKSRNDDKMEEYREKYENSQASKRALRTDDNEEEEEFEFELPAKKQKSVAERMMEKMGHKAGEGLGRNAQGIAEPVALSTQRGRTGLGSAAGKAVARDFTESWDETQEEKTIEETVKWMTNIEEEKRKEICDNLKDDSWMVTREKKLKIDDEFDFCDEKVLTEMLEAKNVFDAMSDRDLREARTRANPYETIGSAFFQNRAAMKTANMDKIYDWILSRENTSNNAFLKKNPLDSATAENIDRNEDLFYFADVCAGPGGFSEYMLWRKGFYNAKGFGFTLKGKDDFKLQKFCAASAFFFECFYGTEDNGDVTIPDNIDSLEQFVMKGTDNVGVHLMMADGGFSVEGQENIQEILSKRIYLCQLLVSLCIVREGGNFFCKLFDIFTPFSVALIYLMRVSYDSVSLHKPHTSRPANSERYITCKGLRREYSNIVRDYLKRVNRKMEELKKKDSKNDIQEIVPLEIMKGDEQFMKELIEHNHYLANRQTMYLRKYQSFAKNQGQFDKDQGNIRDECLKYWAVPNRQRQRGQDRGNRGGNMDRINPMQVYGKYSPKMCGEAEFGNEGPEFLLEFLASKTNANLSYNEYRFVALASFTPHILISAGDQCFLFKNGHFESSNRNFMRIPENTILLVDMADEIEKQGTRIHKKGGAQVIRIIDAAVLCGDDVSQLPYEERMKAAQKFAKALKLTKREIKQGWGKREERIIPNLTVAAHLYSLEEISPFRESLEVVQHERETAALFTEDGITFKCHGLRFSRILKQDWHLAWSKSQQRPYAFSQRHHALGSIFEAQWVEKKLHASFWDTVIMTRKEKERLMADLRQPEKVVAPSSVWKWKACMRTTYGPEKILNHPEAFENRPTIAGIQKLVEKIDTDCHRVRV